MTDHSWRTVLLVEPLPFPYRHCGRPGCSSAAPPEAEAVVAIWHRDRYGSWLVGVFACVTWTMTWTRNALACARDLRMHCMWAGDFTNSVVLEWIAFPCMCMSAFSICVQPRGHRLWGKSTQVILHYLLYMDLHVACMLWPHVYDASTLYKLMYKAAIVHYWCRYYVRCCHCFRYCLC